MGSLVAAYRANTPLIVTAGQQTREMSIIDPYLNNPDATEFPKPWVKWSYEPARAEDVPAAFMQAYAVAMQEPKDRCTCRSRSTTGRSRHSVRRW